MNPYKIAGVLWLLAVLLWPSLASATTYYVATSGAGGSDSNTCTQAQTHTTGKLTVEAGVACLASGDTLEIKAGTYQRTAELLNVPSGGGSWATATTITNYQSDVVVLTAQDPTTGTGTDVVQLPSSRSWIIIDGIDLNGRSDETGLGGKMGVRFGELDQYIRLINMEIHHTRSMIILTNSATNLEFINLDLHHGNHNLPPSDPHYNYSTYGIYMPSGNNLVQNCDIHHNRGYGIHNYSAHAYKPNNNTFIGNRIYDNEKSGIIISQGTGVKFINNLVYNNGTGLSNGYTGDNRHGIHIDLSVSNALIYNNTVYNHPKNEMMFGPSATNITARNNILYKTTAGEYTVRVYSGSTGGTITDNLIYHSNPSFYIQNQGSATISNNINGNPLFTNAGAADFTLQSPSSPAIDKGVTLALVPTDFVDNVRPFPLGGAYDMGAYESGAAPVPSDVIWSATIENPTGTWNDSGFAPYSFRILLDGASLTNNASLVKLTLKGRSSGSYTISGMRLCTKTGTLDCNGTPVQVLFNGSNSVTVNAGELKTSDPIAFGVTVGTDVFFTYFASTGNPGAYLTNGDETQAWFIATTDYSATEDWGGLTITDTRTYIYNVASLQEIVSSLAITPTSASVLVNATVQLSASGGTSPYTYSILNDTTGGATVGASTGLYTAGPNAGTSGVRVTDNVSAVADMTVTVSAEDLVLTLLNPGGAEALTWTMLSDVGVTAIRVYVHYVDSVTVPWRYFDVPYSRTGTKINADGSGTFNLLSTMKTKGPIVLPASVVYFWIRPMLGATEGSLSTRLVYDNS